MVIATEPVEGGGGKIEAYFVTKYGKLYCGNATEILDSLSRDSVDLVVTDPPYGVVALKGDSMFSSYEKFISMILDKLYSVLKYGGQAYIFYSQKRMFSFYEEIEKSKFTFKRMLIWFHPNLSKPTRKMYLYMYDPVFYLIKGEKPKYFNADFSNKHNIDVFVFPKPQTWGNNKRLHPFQKPLDLVKMFIMNSSVRGDLVLDPFAGSGTTLLAAELLKRRWIGIEIYREYCDLIVKRIKSKTYKGWW